MPLLMAVGLVSAAPVAPESPERPEAAWGLEMPVADASTVSPELVEEGWALLSPVLSWLSGAGMYGSYLCANIISRTLSPSERKSSGCLPPGIR